MQDRIRDQTKKKINSGFVCAFRLNGFYFLGIRGTKVRGFARQRGEQASEADEEVQRV